MIEDGTTVLTSVVLIVATHSRFVAARIVPTRKKEDLLTGPCEQTSIWGGFRAAELGQ